MATWHEVITHIGFNGFGEIDSYMDWAFGVRQQRTKLMTGDGPSDQQTGSDLHPVLLCLDGRTSISKFAAGDFFPAGTRPPDWATNVSVPPVYLDDPGLGTDCHFTALVKEAFFDYFEPDAQAAPTPVGSALMTTIARMGVSQQLLAATISNQSTSSVAPLTAPSGTPEQGTVVVGIVDDGIAFANRRFRTAQGRSRVAYIWLQDGDYNAAAARYGYGRSIGKHDTADSKGLDALFASSTYAGLIDEDEVYRKAGALDFGPSRGRGLRTLALRTSHGTHVMDLACGYEPGTSPKSPGCRGEDSRPIVCVQLPAATSEGTSGASLDTFTVDAVRYILDKADAIARERGCGRLPVVINFSYGTIAGRHDGTAGLEQAIDEVISSRRGTTAEVQIIVPAGNSRQRKCHAEVTFNSSNGQSTGPGAVRELRWQMVPDSRATSHLEIWLPKAPKGTQGRVRIRVKPPFGEISPPLEEQVRPVRVWGRKTEQGLCYIRYAQIPDPTSRGMFLITVKPTQSHDYAVAPSGIWTVILENLSLGPEEVVDAWIQRNDTRYGYLPFGRQSYFEDDNYVPVGENGKIPELDAPACLIKRAGTLNAIATGQHAIVVGGFRKSTMLAADYSGEGLARWPAHIGPDALAPSDDSIGHGGVLAAATRSGSVVALNGTSVAVPIITRMVADLLAEGKPADREAIRAIAAAQETAAGASRPLRPIETRGGAGRITAPSTTSVQRLGQ